MKCKYGDTWLTGTSWKEDCGEVEWSADQDVNVVPLIGRATPYLSGRGNVRDTLPVPISLSFQSAEAALQYCAALPWQLPQDGVLRFEEGLLSIVFSKAAFNNVTRKQNGTRVDAVYEFTVPGPPTVTGS